MFVVTLQKSFSIVGFSFFSFDFLSTSASAVAANCQKSENFCVCSSDIGPLSLDTQLIQNTHFTHRIASVKKHSNLNH